MACEREVTTAAPIHVCASRRPNKAHNALFTMWAMLHTKSCPACAARIQRNHGCSHMTCTRCSSYFCWRCKGFLNNGCPLPGRACICDRVMTAAAYSGLAVAGVVGSPVIMAALVVAGPPYLAYRMVSARRARARADDVTPYAHVLNQMDALTTAGTAARARHARTAARSILHPTELMSHDDEFDSASTPYMSSSDDEDIGNAMDTDVEGPSAAVAAAGVDSEDNDANEHTTIMASRSDRDDSSDEQTLSSISRPRLQVARSTSSMALIRARRGAPWVINGAGDEAAQRAARYVLDGVLMHGEGRLTRESAPSLTRHVECVVSRPFVLERRRGSVGS